MFWLCSYFELLSTLLTLHLFITMSAPVSHLTVEETHKEFKSFEDKIAAKYEQ